MSSSADGSKFPSLVVFDLDECVWHPEMYTLSSIPTAKDAIKGDLGNGHTGIVGVRSGRSVIQLFPGAREIFQKILGGEYGSHMRVAAASSADTPQAVRIGRAAMGILEVLPGVTLLQAFLSIGGGFEETGCNLQIGRTAPLSSNKSATHFPILRKNCGIDFSQMLFFDDCNWTDHVAAVTKHCKGVVAVRTPNGLSLDLWEEGLELFDRKVKQVKMIV